MINVPIFKAKITINKPKFYYFYEKTFTKFVHSFAFC